MGLLDDYKRVRKTEEIANTLKERIISMDESLKEISKKLDTIIKILEKKK